MTWRNRHTGTHRLRALLMAITPAVTAPAAPVTAITAAGAKRPAAAGQLPAVIGRHHILTDSCGNG
jgi:hypothetical protein